METSPVDNEARHKTMVASKSKIHLYYLDSMIVLNTSLPIWPSSHDAMRQQVGLG